MIWWIEQIDWMIFVYWEWWISIEATKICYFGLALSDIGSQPTRLSDVLNLKNLKTVWGIKFFFFSSIEVTKNTLFWVVPESSLGQSVCRIFYFWLVWLVDLNTGGPLLHCTCFYWKIWWILWKSSVIILWCYKDVGKRTNKWFGKH